MSEEQKRLRGTSLNETLSDEEVAKAILNVMKKSKKWQEHEQLHKGAELVIIATPGLETSFNEQPGKLPNIVTDLDEQRTAQFRQTRQVEEAEEEQEVLNMDIYGTKGEGLGNVQYGTFNGNVGNVQYGIQGGSASQAMVVAGCPCGFFTQIAASNGKMLDNSNMEDHKNNHKLGVSFGSVYSGNLDSLYGPQNAGAAGYGSNSVEYGTGSTDAYGSKDNPGKGFLDHERTEGTGF